MDNETGLTIARDLLTRPLAGQATDVDRLATMHAARSTAEDAATAAVASVR